MEWKLDNGWRNYKKMETVSSNHQSKLFRFCEKTVPYLPFIFKNKRQRVKCRLYFRYHWWRKCEKYIVSVLSNYTAKPINLDEISKELDKIEYWDIQKNASV